MKTKYISIAICIIIALLFLKYVSSNYFTINMLKGTYVNTNYDNNMGGEAPSIPDTIIIFENGTFESQFWGIGTYNLIYSIEGTKIYFVYNFELGKAGYNAFIKRDWFSSPKIILNSDSNQFFRKVED